MAGIPMKVSFLIDVMLAHVGQRGSDDLKYYWFETIYKTIREQPWPWNFATTFNNTAAPFTTTETYNWVAGSRVISTLGVVSPSYLYTGRSIIIDERLYRIERIDPTALTITLDRPLATSPRDASTITLHRDLYSVKTSSIRRVDLDGRKVPSTTPEYWRKLGGQRYESMDTARPSCYKVLDNYKVPPPVYAPIQRKVTLGAGFIPDGTYEWFWTFYDHETGEDSAPGPSLITELTGGPQSVEVGYDNPLSGDVSEYQTFTMRLWRTRRNPDGTRNAVHFVASKDPLSTGNPTDIYPDNQLIFRERYYDGDRTVFQWRKFPDALYSVDVEHIDSYECRPYKDDRIYTGINNTVPELLGLGVSSFVELANRDPNAQMQAIIKWRQQLAYLVKKTGAGNADDPGFEDIKPLSGIPDDVDFFDPTRSYTYRD